MADATSGDVFPFSEAEVIFMKDLLYAALGLLSAAAAAFFMYSGVSQKVAEKTNTPFILFAIFGILTLVFGALFFSGRVNKQEEIHITE
jgi:intracellular septation protein A